MKKTIYLLAWIFSFIFVTGLLFLILRLPYAIKLLYIGETGAGLLCFPIILYYKWKEKKLEHKQLLYQWISGQSFLIIFVLSTWARFINDFLANILFSGSFFIFGFIFLPLLFHNMYKQSLLEI
ncbi:hypothetical protein JKA74_03145 [Marivirga sp. S37H4]|uniref:Uncharacterized protein n=1 Tax=Marivirga aurantiaca TaxID=2802615 RepID=A0A934WW46_9BACT|nr:hypothetical protein [Marivirga aurantiaca]MBK6264021.1 hypothetical protein [Marivirga aurantiaca]